MGSQVQILLGPPPSVRSAIARRVCVGVLGWLGGVAQLGERLLCKQEVIGSIPFASTTVAQGKSSLVPFTSCRGGTDATAPLRAAMLFGIVEMVLWRVHAARLGFGPAGSVDRVMVLSREPARAPFVLRMVVGSQAQQEHLVDALAPRGDEGRGTLRKAAGSCERTLIRRYPNGETHPSGYPVMNP